MALIITITGLSFPRACMPHYVTLLPSLPPRIPTYLNSGDGTRIPLHLLLKVSGQYLPLVNW